MSSRRPERAARRSRVPILAAVVLVAAAAATLVRVPAGELAVRSWRGGGTPSLLRPGLALRLPWLQRLERFPSGQLTAEGRVEVASREGASLHLPFSATAHLGEQELLALSR